MDESRRCTGHNRRGGRCGRAAAHGQKVCVSHGAKSPQAIRKARERIMEQEISEAAEKYAATAGPITDPLGELLKVAAEIKGFKDYLAQRVAELREWRWEGPMAEQLHAEVALYERALDRTARVLVDISRLGLEERLIRVSEQQGAILADAIRTILGELDLSDEQQRRVPEVVPRVLRAVADLEAS